VVDTDDKFAYCGTKTGDFLEISLDKALYKRSGPAKKLFSKGITALVLLTGSEDTSSGDIIVGTGDGTIARVSKRDFKVKVEAKLMGAITSLQLTADQTHFFAGTDQCNVYWVGVDAMAAELRTTCHHSRINDLAFPNNYSDVFATASEQNIRVWNAKTRQELLRVQVPNLECFCLCFSANGKHIISGWSDGKIRSFLPISGKLA
jgi:WD40 repeat protein